MKTPIKHEVSTLIIYHSRDLDGYCSGAIAKLKYPHAKLIGYDYNQPIPWEDIKDHKRVVILDVSIPPDDLYAVYSHVLELIWIDHHKSSIEDYKVYCNTQNHGMYFGEVEIFTGMAACELAWNYFFHDQEMPLAVELLGKYDTWRNAVGDSWENETLPFQFGMRVECNSPETFPTDLFYNTMSSYATLWNIRDNGRRILSYQRNQNERAMGNSFVAYFQCYRALMVNMGGANSEVFKSVYDPEKHDLMMPFVFGKNGWTFTIFSDKPDIDCSALAKKYGGGGHRGAAGFKVKEFKDAFPDLKI